LDDRYRVGFLLIEPSSPVVKCTAVPCASTTEYLPIDVFTSTQKNLFYSIFYAQQPGGGTPLRAALARAGRYFAHKTDGINNGMTDDRYSIPVSRTSRCSPPTACGKATVTLSSWMAPPRSAIRTTIPMMRAAW
jgi:hypothetical protein